MKFKVEFVAKGYDVINMPSREIGLEDVDRIRKECGVPKLELDKISGMVHAKKNNETIILSERDARRCGEIFADRCNVEISAPSGWLNLSVVEKVWVDRNEETGEIIEAGLKYTLDTRRVIESWIDYGCPLKWGLEE